MGVKPCELKKAENERVIETDSGTKEYAVRVGGTLDGVKTAQYLETYNQCMREEPRFEPSRYLIIENHGPEVLVNPRVVVDGRRNWFSVDTILSGILHPGMSDAEKAMAIFRFTSSIEIQAHDNNRRVGPPFPGSGSERETAEKYPPKSYNFRERANPVKAANCYYASGCSLSAANFVILCRHAGLVARAVWMSPLDNYQTHCVGEVRYGGDWHLFDPERRSFYLDEDNQTVASYEDLHKKPHLAARTHDGGFASQGMESHAPDYAGFYPPHVMPVEQWLSTMELELRPGERYIWSWDDCGKYRYGNNFRQKPHLKPYRLANGKLIYEPVFSDPALWRDSVAVNNAVQEGGRLRPDSPSAPAQVIYRLDSPYPVVGGLVGGKFRVEGGGEISIHLSVHGRKWERFLVVRESGENYTAIDDRIDPLHTPAAYEYYVKFELSPGEDGSQVYLDKAYMETDVQMSQPALPALRVGINSIHYTDDSPKKTRVRIIHGWNENSMQAPPLTPRAPVFPADGGEVKMQALRKLSFAKARPWGDDQIAEYHIQVSPREDFLHPVSPNFNRITFSSRPEWEVPQGWLLGGSTYYWRVRARSESGVWSGWSEPWSFSLK